MEISFKQQHAEGEERMMLIIPTVLKPKGYNLQDFDGSSWILTEMIFTLKHLFFFSGIFTFLHKQEKCGKIQKFMSKIELNEFSGYMIACFNHIVLYTVI